MPYCAWLMILKIMGQFCNIKGMPLPDEHLTKEFGHSLIAEELNYNVDELRNLHEKQVQALNPEQKCAFGVVMDSVKNNTSRLLFVNGHERTGKTFLWKTIVSGLRFESKIVLPIATLGIATLLLPGDRTTHLRFHIPLDGKPNATCEIKHWTQLANL